MNGFILQSFHHQKQKRTTGLIVSLIFLLVSLAIGSLLIGSFAMNLNQIVSAAQGELGSISQMILLDYRLPRTLAAMLVGACLGMAGAIFQTLLKNPLASPDIMGFTAGAGVGALSCVVLFSGSYLVLGAIAGGLITATLVLFLSWRSGLNTYRLVLVGIGFNFLLVAILDLILSRIDINQAMEMNKWLAGTLNATHWQHVKQLVIGLLLLLPLVFFLQFKLNLLAFDDDLATALGIEVNKVRLAIIIVGVLLTALAVTVAGPLPFIAFVSGPIARRLLKNSGAVLFTAGLVGALVTLLADTCARYLGLWVNMPTGVFTALIGAPYLLWLLASQIRRGQL
jgi:iron complex transport system permease protein